MSYEIEYHDYDVVVVGAGGAGLRATVGAVENGYKTACISKGSNNTGILLLRSDKRSALELE